MNPGKCRFCTVKQSVISILTGEIYRYNYIRFQISFQGFRSAGNRKKEEEAVMTISLAVYIFICVMCAFVVKGLVGFGDPLVYNPLLSLQLDNKSISPAMLPVSVVLNASIA